MSEEHTQKELTRLEYARQCAKALEQKGYEVNPVSLGSLNSGADVVAKKFGITYAVRCRYAPDSPVEADAVKQALAGMKAKHCDAAAVMTNSTFSDDARELAEANDVLLWSDEKVENKNPGTKEHRGFYSVSQSRDDLTSFEKPKRRSSFRVSLAWLIVVVIVLVVLLFILSRFPALQGHNIIQGIISRLTGGLNF